MVFFDDIEPKDYTTTNGRVYFSLKNDVKNHYISKIAIGFGESEHGFSSEYVVIRVNEESKYFTFLDLVKASNTEWDCQVA